MFFFFRRLDKNRITDISQLGKTGSKLVIYSLYVYHTNLVVAYGKKKTIWDVNNRKLWHLIYLVFFPFIKTRYAMTKTQNLSKESLPYFTKVKTYSGTCSLYTEEGI